MPGFVRAFFLYFRYMKSLIINGVEYCKYEIDGNICFLNVSKIDNIIIDEDLLGAIISMVENIEIVGLGYLNI